MQRNQQPDVFRWFFPWCGLALLAVSFSGCRETPSAATGPEAVSVTVASPIERAVADYEDFTGRTDAVQKVEIHARVTGYLENVCFQDGAEVKKGDLLFEIDPRPFQAKYDEALAQIKIREAELEYRKAELNRASRLVTKSAVSQSDYDRSVAEHSQAIAAVAAAKAAADEAKLNLDFTKLYAPIDGEISRAYITKGNLVRADETLLTTIVSVDPIYAYFDVDEHTILEVKEDIRTGRIKAKDDEEVPVTMGLANEKGFPHHGHLDFMENQLDPNTGTIRVRGLFPNPKPAVGARVLKAGNFVRVRVTMSETHKALLIPERAIGRDQNQKYVLVVDDKDVAQYRPIVSGKIEEGLQVIEKGLKPGDRVIVGGLQRVRPGMKVAPRVVDMKTFLEEREVAQPSAANTK